MVVTKCKLHTHVFHFRYSPCTTRTLRSKQLCLHVSRTAILRYCHKNIVAEEDARPPGMSAKFLSYRSGVDVTARE